MATPAHCFYCFECLSTSFEGREPPSLEKVQDLWEQYQHRQKLDHIAATAAAGRQDDTMYTQGEEEHTLDEDDTEDEEDEDEVEDEDEDEDDEHPTKADIAAPIQSPVPQLPSVTRLQAPTPSSRSSNSSSPSIFSAASSNSGITNTSSISSASNQSTYASRLSITESYPLFVTWNTISRVTGSKSLRGCIGTFDPLPLETGLQTYSLTSAFDDTRFSPIPRLLLPALSCSLTLLANFEPCANALDWVLGRHGLRISFTHRGRRYGATYLPDVAVEQGWTKEETLESLMKKAGWDGGTGHAGYARRLLRGSVRAANVEDEPRGKPWDEVGDFRTVRYTGLKASASYAEWKEWRNWVDGLEQKVL